MEDAGSRSAQSNLRGWLSDVYMPALVAGECRQLARRLGDRATVDDPLFGRASGSAAVLVELEKLQGWLAKHGASFVKTAFVMGPNRDVTEGTLSATFDGRTTVVPLAVVSERHRERAVDLRIYYATRALRPEPAIRPPLLVTEDETAVPPPLESYLDSLQRGDIAGAVASFEEGAVLRDAAGVIHVKQRGAGPLWAYHAKLLGGATGASASALIVKNARADDGRTCALEYTVTRIRGRDVPPQAGFAVFERSESGLLKAMRVYDDIGVAD